MGNFRVDTRTPHDQQRISWCCWVRSRTQTLIRNALDALSTVSSHSDEATQEPEVSLTVTASSDKVQLIVLDNGPGIAPELLPQLFDPFVTSKTIGHGLGLGLAIVRSILQDLGGSIQAENRATLEGEKTGASFTVTLPRTCPH